MFLLPERKKFDFVLQKTLAMSVVKLLDCQQILEEIKMTHLHIALEDKSKC